MAANESLQLSSPALVGQPVPEEPSASCPSTLCPVWDFSFLDRSCFLDAEGTDCPWLHHPRLVFLAQPWSLSASLSPPLLLHLPVSWPFSTSPSVSWPCPGITHHHQGCTSTPNLWGLRAGHRCCWSKSPFPGAVLRLCSRRASEAES